MVSQPISRSITNFLAPALRASVQACSRPLELLQSGVQRAFIVALQSEQGFVTVRGPQRMLPAGLIVLRVIFSVFPLLQPIGHVHDNFQVVSIA